MSDVVVHVADASSSAVDAQIDAVRRVLGEIDAGELPEVLALNKIDRLSGSERARIARTHAGAVPVSALTGEGVWGLLESIEATLPHPPVEATFVVPYGREDLSSRLYRDAEVLGVEHDGDGTRITARVGPRELAALREFVASPVTERATEG